MHKLRNTQALSLRRLSELHCRTRTLSYLRAVYISDFGFYYCLLHCVQFSQLAPRVLINDLLHRAAVVDIQ